MSNVNVIHNSPMNLSNLQLEMVRQRALEVERRAQRFGPLLAAAAARPEEKVVAGHEPLTVRLAATEDWPLLRVVAELDSAALPPAPLLVGERDGRTVAALSLADGSVIANPFVCTADVVAMLQLRGRQLGVERRRLPGRALAWRLSRAGS
jgi:hypothetical protein